MNNAQKLDSLIERHHHPDTMKPLTITEKIWLRYANTIPSTHSVGEIRDWYTQPAKIHPHI
jgi:hypothetical protein